MLALSAPSDERAARQQCHVIRRDYTNMTHDAAWRLINASNADADADAADTTPSQDVCVAWVYDRTEHGRLLAEYVSTLHRVCEYPFIGYVSAPSSIDCDQSLLPFR